MLRSIAASKAFRPPGACLPRAGLTQAAAFQTIPSASESVSFGGVLSRGLAATPLSLGELQPGFDASEVQFILSDKVNFLFERLFETEAGMWILHTAAFYTLLKMFAHYFFWQPAVVKHYQDRPMFDAKTMFDMFASKKVLAQETAPIIADAEKPVLAGLGAGQLTKALPLYFEQFAKEWQALTAQDNFDGFRLEAGKAVTKNLQASHSLILGTNLRECGYLYQFGPTWQSVDGRTFATARVGLDGAVNGRYGTKFGSNVELKLSASSSLKDAQRNGGEFELGYLGKHNTAALKFVHQGTWILNTSYAQEISDNLWLGSELTFIPMNGISLTSFGARYVTGPHVLSGTVGQQPDFKARSPLDSSTTSKVQYVKKVSDRLSLGAEVETSFPDRDSALRLGYEYTFRQAKVQGMVDTAGRVSCFVSDFMGFGVSGAIDYLKGDYKFGFMMHIVPQPEQQ